MAESFIDSDGKLLAYRLHEEIVKFEVSRAEDKSRLSRMESRLEDIMNRITKSDDTLATLKPMLMDLLGTWTSVCNRLERVEEITKPINALATIIKKPVILILGLFTTLVTLFYSCKGDH